ncbi:MAG: ABC transporter ATP-binding protein [Anaerolineales bacterium]|nr:ABC transporter ATP-binding protein [Anaerolineales bacterium]
MTDADIARLVPPLIEAFHLRKTWHNPVSHGQTVAADNVSLSIAAGEIYGLVGPDGAGKTTVMRLLCGAYQPDQITGGSETQVIRLAGNDLFRHPEQARAQIGYLPQRFSLYEELTVMENLRFFAEVRGLRPAEWRPRCMEILAFVGLDPYLDRRAGYLSGGMRQKLGLAAALVHRPPILLLDEPTTGVDPVTRQDFWQLIIHLVGQQNANTAVLVSTPYMDEAARCTRIGFMNQGRIMTEGSPIELCSRLEGRILELIGQPLNLLRRTLAEMKPDIEDVQMFGDRLHLRVRQGQAEAIIAQLQEIIPAQGGQLTRLRLIAPQLEDVFIGMLQPAPEVIP